MPVLRKARQILYRTEEDVRKALLDVALFIIFLAVTTNLALSCQHVYMFYFTQSIERIFVKGPTTTQNFGIEFENIATVNEWWNYVEHNFLNNLDKNLIYRQNKTNDDVTNTQKILEVLTENNFLLGVPKLRQIRVKSQSCQLHKAIEKQFASCYGRYRYDMEMTTAVYKGTLYVKRQEYKATPIDAIIKKYNGPGYVEFLSYEKHKSIEIIHRLKANDWIDDGTRLVLLEFVVYNTNTHLFNNIKLMAEVLPTGALLPIQQIQPVPLYTIWSPTRPGLIIVAIIFYLMVIYYTAIEIQEMFESGLKAYVRDKRNYVDLIILITAFIALELTMQHPFAFDDYLESIAKDERALVSLDEPCFWYFTYIWVIALCTFVVWIKIFQFVSFNKTMLQFSTTLQRCAWDIVGFAIMFVIVFVGFSLFGLMVFGSASVYYACFQSAMFTMVRTVLGDFSYSRVESANRFFGPILCLAYILFIYFILLNMFLAIINETYSSVKSEITDGHSGLKNFIIHVWQRIVRFCKRLKTRPTSLAEVQSMGHVERHNTLEYDERPLSKKPNPKASAAGKKSATTEPDELDEGLARLIERIDLLETALLLMNANMNHILKKKEVREN